MKQIRKIMLIALAFVAVASAGAQTIYVSPGVNLSANTTSYSAELGVQYPKAIYAVGYDYTPVGKFQSVDVKFYYKLVTSNKFGVWSYNAFTGSLDKGHQLSFGPGAAITYDVSSRLSPQFTANVPITEGWQTSLCYSFSINYNFKSTRH